MPPEQEETQNTENFDNALSAVEEGLGLDQPETEDAPPDEGSDKDAVAPAAPAKPVPQATQDPPAAAAPPTAKPPSSWKPEEVAGWEALPPHVQAAVHRREADFHSRLAELEPHRNLSEGFTKMLAPYAQVMQDYNVNPWDHVSSLLSAHATLMFGSPEQKVAILRDVIAQTGIDSAKLVAGDPAPYDPQQQALQQEIHRLQRTLSGVVGEVSTSRLAEMERQVEAFARQPENVYFEDLLPDMIRLMKENPNQTLSQVYERALWANPVTKAKEIDRRAKELADRQAKEASERVQKARRTTATNVQSRSGGRATSASDSWEADLGTMLEEIKAR